MENGPKKSGKINNPDIIQTPPPPQVIDPSAPPGKGNGDYNKEKEPKKQKTAEREKDGNKKKH